MVAIAWWSLIRHFESLQYDPNYNPNPIFSAEEALLKRAILAENSYGRSLLTHYINATGSEQYWDFFAPASPKFHQYLSVCTQAIKNLEQGTISCTGVPAFTNYSVNFKGFDVFTSDDSRLYRLTENIINLNEATLYQALTQYYQAPFVIVHQFELSPGLKGLPKFGYQSDYLVYPKVSE